MKAVQVWLDKVQDKEKVGQWYAVLCADKLLYNCHCIMLYCLSDVCG